MLTKNFHVNIGCLNCTTSTKKAVGTRITKVKIRTRITNKIKTQEVKVFKIKQRRDPHAAL